MEDVLDLYAAPYDPARPVVCFDESPKQLIGEVRAPLPVEPGRPARQDTEYQRNGVRDLMMICEPKQGRRDVLIMERRTKVEFAHCMRHIVATYPDAEVIRVVLDNLNTHKAASLYAAFPPEEARAIARKIEFLTRDLKIVAERGVALGEKPAHLPPVGSLHGRDAPRDALDLGHHMVHTARDDLGRLDAILIGQLVPQFG